MVKQFEDCITMFGEHFSASVSSPATKKVSDLREDSEQLFEEKRELFQLVVEKLLFIIKRSRADLETAVSFLTDIVSKSDVENWERLI